MASESKAQWREAALEPLKKRYPERRDSFSTSSDLEVDTVYVPQDLDGFDYTEKLGFPGEYPYTRGVQPNMYRGRLWTMRQYAGLASPEESNRRYRYLLDQGQTGLSIAFDLPTQTGYDSDHPMATGEVGRVGVPISSLADMEVLLDGIPLDRVSTSMTINATASILLALYVAVGKKQGVPLDKLTRHSSERHSEGVHRQGHLHIPAGLLNEAGDRRLPLLQPERPPLEHHQHQRLSHERGRGHRRPGARLHLLERHCVCAVGRRRRSGRGQDSRPTLFLLRGPERPLRGGRQVPCGPAHVGKDHARAVSGPRTPDPGCSASHTQTAGVTLTAQQPDNNVIRTTVQALAAVLGGTQSLHVNSKDEALALPTEESVQLSLRTQQILAHESGVTDTVDPLAGSYYVESLTDRLEDEAFRHIERIDELGGAVAALEDGYQIREIHESAYRHQRAVEREERIVVGVNRYQASTPPIAKMQSIEPEQTQSQLRRLARVRRERDDSKVEASLARLEEVARGSENTVPAILECVEAYATVGEIADVFRGAFGEQREFTPF